MGALEALQKTGGGGVEGRELVHHDDDVGAQLLLGEDGELGGEQDLVAVEGRAEERAVFGDAEQEIARPIG